MCKSLATTLFSYVFALICLLKLLLLNSPQATCPENTNYVRRVGNTKYFILQDTKRGKFLTQTEAKTECEKYGLKLAKVRNMLSLAVVGRALEKLGNLHKLRDTWYWLDAIHDDKTEKYYWGDPDDDDVVQYSNMLYRPPRPLGVGAHVNFTGLYQEKLPLQQCLALSLPWPWPLENGSVYGFQACFDERYCLSKTSRHAMCESLDEACDHKANSSFQISETQTKYFEEGNWIMGTRKYMINWKHRTFNETDEYCKSLGLQLLTPGKEEKLLIPHIKMWSRGVTTSLFWTSLKFNAATMQFLDASGKVVADSKYQVNFTEEVELVDGRRFTRSSKLDETFCVALSLSYELKSQMPCPDNSSSCNWSFIQYVPSNCNNYHAVICQHHDHDKKRKISWPKINKKNLSSILNSEEMLTSAFGFDKNKEVRRSKVKQTFGLCYCPKDYRMMRYWENSTYWEKPPKNQKAEYTYDYMEEYWVVDKQHYNKTAESNCTVAYVEPGNVYERKFKKVPCTEWHFYLCEKKDAKSKDRKTTWGNFTKSVPMEWADGPQPRVYPLVYDVIISSNDTSDNADSSEEISTTEISVDTTTTQRPKTQAPKKSSPQKKKIKTFEIRY